jgi:fumarylacetoacetate (FAA) hydrolase
MFSPREADLARGWPGRIEGDRVVQLAAQTLQSFFTGGGHAREHAEYRLDEVVLRAPVLRPPSVRIFELGAEPRFTFANPASIYGPEDEVPYPDTARELGYGPGLAALVGADETIGGFTILNAWVAPDLAPPKDRDFATSIGPIVVTPDELTGLSRELRVRVNGEPDRAGAVDDLQQTWQGLAEHAGRNTRLVPGDILGLGGTGSHGRRLRPSDVVEVEVEGIGVLRNRIAEAG